MKAVSKMLIGSGLAMAAALCAATWGQDKAPASGGPAKVLVIFREFVKPGKAGTPHDKTESAFVEAMAKAKWPTHYVAASSMSGKPRVLFFTRYDSYEAWEKDVTATNKNAVLSAALDRAGQADGALLDSSDQNVFSYNEQFSLRPVSDISHMRYLEIWVVHVKPGHYREWEELNKLYKAAYEKAVPQGHWAVYEAGYGMPNGTYLFMTARKTASELDRGPEDEKATMAAIGEDGMKKLDELFAASVESSESQFFSFSPQMSYPPDEWAKADPDFWKPKPTAAPAAKAEKRPAAD
jgi:hypothetical protein